MVWHVCALRPLPHLTAITSNDYDPRQVSARTVQTYQEGRQERRQHRRPAPFAASGESRSSRHIYIYFF